MCLKRLYQLKARLDKDKSLLEQYDNIIKEQSKSGIIESVVEPGQRSHYLPHHGVQSEDKETIKLRVVFDGSARSSKDDVSLNDCLEKGPNLVPHLFDTVVNFRGYPIGLLANIEKAFHQIAIATDDRKMLKFLWFEDINQDSPTVKEYEFRRLPFGLTSSPSILSSIIAHHLSKYKEIEPEIVALLLESLNVDDFAGGAYDDDEALDIYRKSQDLMSKVGFKLRKWHSNSEYIRNCISAQENAIEGSKDELPKSKLKHSSCNTKNDTEESFVEDSLSCQTSQNPLASKQNCVNILGTSWNEYSDEFCYDLSELVEYSNSLPPTERSVLKLSAKVFDPIGLFAPFTVTMKILFQTLCSGSLDWDDELDGKTLASWKSLVNDLQALSDIPVARCYFHHTDELSRNHEIHGFSDASDLAFAAVVYLRTEYSNGDVELSLIVSKTRVASIKRQTIPRLELLGANILARLVDTIIKALTSIKLITNVVLWTDSFTTLCWIRNHKVWKTYVQNRVNEIRELTSNYEWRHCPGELNPADLPSRGCSGRELAEAETWWNGPKFLQTSREHWPQDPQPPSKVNDEVLSEEMKNPTEIVHLLYDRSLNDFVHIEEIIDPKRYSTKIKLLRVTARVIRFIRKISKQLRTTSIELTADELIEAEKLWIRSIQSIAFAEEINSLHHIDRKNA
ncbi:uncharacterized protein LOC114534774 [Dendronephthya gigantea]|uniref:uncharacterized protein LOC114534774 n=1 Tax=Dendronephthya gigantea TaxID=151771 RepID=UPI00106B0D60|nr:uncharacterized protein LOC114534774 [Dendronephthya gigantea]